MDSKSQAQIDLSKAREENVELKMKATRANDEMNATLQQFFTDVVEKKNLKWLVESYPATLADSQEEILYRATVGSEGVTGETLKSCFLDEEYIKALEKGKAIFST